MENNTEIKVAKKIIKFIKNDYEEWSFRHYSHGSSNGYSKVYNVDELIERIKDKFVMKNRVNDSKKPINI